MLSDPRVRIKEQQIIILEDLDFAWEQNKINLAKELWEKGENFKTIKSKLKRQGDEVFLLLMHLVRQGIIKEREGGIYG